MKGDESHESSHPSRNSRVENQPVEKQFTPDIGGVWYHEFDGDKPGRLRLEGNTRSAVVQLSLTCVVALLQE